MVEKVVLHPKLVDIETFTYARIAYDIALFKLTKDLDLNNPNGAIRSICLPNSAAHRPKPGSTCTVTGWGSANIDTDDLPSILQKANFTVVRQDDCVQAWKQPSPDYPDYSFPSVIDSNICVSRAPAVPCHGDSGGPLQCFDKYNGGRWFLQGVASWGEPNCNYPELHPTVFTRVTSVLDWIKENINEL